ncbi:peptidyl-prolyl cis-trans isomerase [Clostridium sp. AM58-1XD]|uniref:peptidylprolyl isomerase n=1 Tax=Clostridium sp. AM58-1XD TaxID=2292307 RepID=UPI000E4CC9A6|nr:peptidyl-prolyl cis-trans isomerase [Clostridium sp. AM58-1XD]RGZ00906.1 peptidylprolyl isomerase [Clostridium sp. AM58-1XD]
MKFGKRWKTVVLPLTAAALLLGGCKGIPLMSEAKESKQYTEPQTMIFVATERNRYESIYTDQIWGVKMDDSGTTFENYLLDQIKSFLEEMRTVTMMAREQDISLDAAEKEKVNRLTEDYYKKLSREDIEYMGIDKDDVRIMYQEYCLANKMVTETTKDMDLEVSDSEAKVMVLQQIEVWNKETADLVWQKTQEEGADFAAIAAEYSLNPDLERKLGRGEDDKALEDAAFALTEGEVSSVIEVGPAYYIVKCLNEYDMDATQERKKVLEIEKKDQIFRQIYNEYAQKNPVDFGDEMWEELKFSGDDGCTTTNFFEMYHEYFKN